jgi:hypothetical protein
MEDLANKILIQCTQQGQDPFVYQVVRITPKRLYLSNITELVYTKTDVKRTDDEPPQYLNTIRFINTKPASESHEMSEDYWVNKAASTNGYFVRGQTKFRIIGDAGENSEYEYMSPRIIRL